MYLQLILNLFERLIKMKKLIVYFSASGNTKVMADKLAKATGADLFEIKPQTPYTRADLDWTNKNSRSSVEMNDKSYRPQIAELPNSLADYDTIFIGFPIWWYVAPTIINTFVESVDLSGKKVIPFATSGGSGMGKTLESLKESCPNANWAEGKVINGMSEKALADWAEKF